MEFWVYYWAHDRVRLTADRYPSELDLENRGNFVNPEKYYPETFGKIQILRTYPYLLPCLLSAVLTMCSIIVGAVFLKEVCQLCFLNAPQC